MADDRLVDDPRAARRVPGEDDLGRQVEDDGGGRDAGRGRPREERPSRRGLDAGRIDDRQLSRGQTPRELAVEPPECGVRRALVGLVARDHRAETVRREDLVRGEVPCRERRLAHAGRADQDDQARVRDVDLGDHLGRRSGGPRSLRPRRRGSRTRAGRTAPDRAGRGRRSPGTASRATGTRRSRRRTCPGRAVRPRARRRRGGRGSMSATRTRTRSLIPALALVGVASGSVARSVTSPVSSLIHFVPAPRNAWRLTMLPKM